MRDTMGESKKILLDTNFLLIPVQFGVDIFEEIQRISQGHSTLWVLQASLDELSNIAAKGRGKDAIAARVATQLVHAKSVNVIPTRGYVDDAILTLARQHPERWAIATQDAQLRKQLRNSGVACIALRQKKYVILQPPR